MNQRLTGRSSMTSKRGKYKTELCIHYSSTGTCYYGAKCHYAHGREDIRVPGSAHPRYKTSLCKNELGNRSCQFGDRCMFIHRCDPQYHALKSLAERPDRSNVPTILHQHMPEKKGNDSQIASENIDETANPTLQTAFENLALGPAAASPVTKAPNAKSFATSGSPNFTTVGVPLTTSGVPLPNGPMMLGGWAPVFDISEADRRYAAASVWGAPTSPERKGLAGSDFPPLALAPSFHAPRS